MNKSPVDNCHFTYRPSVDAPHLQQGDLLEKTQDIAALLQAIHPHYYRKQDYTHFLVLTQSCDLVRREGKPCKAKYISLAAVRPLNLVVEREIARYQEAFEKDGQLCSSAKRGLLEEFLKKILNNNDPEYFYLEPEPTFGLHRASCAFLRLSVAVRAHEHYEKLLAARQLSLADVFQAKLGWLVGNMYSRVGTEDWVPENIAEHDFKKKIADILDDSVRWVDAEQLKAAKKAAPQDLTGREQIRDYIAGIKAPKRKDRALETIVRIAREQALLSDERAADNLRRRLDNDPDFSGLFK